MKIMRYLLVAVTLCWGPALYSQDSMDTTLRAGDRFKIYVEKQEYLNAEVDVSETGAIRYHRLGEIAVGGLTVAEAQRRIAETIRLYYPYMDAANVTIVVDRGEYPDEQSVAAPTQQPVPGEPPPELTPSYRICPYDTLEITVFGEKDLDRKVRVSEKGTIKLPLVGDVTVAGLTVEEVTQKIEDMLTEGYFVNPQVTVFIASYAKFSISGEVAVPGTFELEGALTLGDALVLAQGPKEQADLEHVKVIRTRDGMVTEHIVSVEKEGKAFYLQPQDRVVVEAKECIYILGAVEKPGMYYMTQKDLVMRDALTFLAGGVKPDGNLGRIEIIRKENGENKTYAVNMEEQGDTFALRSQDRIIVRTYENISILGQVNKPGKYPYKSGITAVDAIAMAGGFTDVAARNSVKVIRKSEGRQKSIQVPVGKILSTGDTTLDVGLYEGDAVVVSESWF